MITWVWSVSWPAMWYFVAIATVEILPRTLALWVSRGCKLRWCLFRVLWITLVLSQLAALGWNITYPIVATKYLWFYSSFKIAFDVLIWLPIDVWIIFKMGSWAYEGENKYEVTELTPRLD